jgi:hypothetical protein
MPSLGDRLRRRKARFGWWTIAGTVGTIFVWWFVWKVLDAMTATFPHWMWWVAGAIVLIAIGWIAAVAWPDGDAPPPNPVYKAPVPDPGPYPPSGPTAIKITGGGQGLIKGNVVRGFEVGIDVRDSDDVKVEDNDVER